MDTSALQQNAAETVHRLAIGKRPSRTLQVIAITYGFGVTQGHRQCHHSTERIRFPISTLIETTRLSFSSYSELFWQKEHILTYPTCIWPMSFGAIYTGKRLAGSSCYLVRTYRPYPGAHCARWGTQFPLSGKGSQQATTFGPCLIVAKRSPISAAAELCAKWIHTAFLSCYIPL